TRAPRASSARAADFPANRTPQTRTVRPKGSSGESAMSDELGVEQPGAERDGQSGDDPEAHDDRDLLPSGQLEMVVDRRHLEYPLAGPVADGTIDCVATDHAPHAIEDKETEWGAALPGMLGLQTALAIVIETMVEPGLLDWRGVADRMSVAPARIGALAEHGRPIAIGEPANLVVVDPTIRWTVSPAALVSKSRNTPYAGRTLPGR